MSGGGGLTPSSLTADLTFNWVFLVELLVCAIVTLFFLFYFNRLFATCISYGLRAWTWHRYRVYIDIQALQISFLGGRIFFKGVRYHGNNETILIQSGFLTWRYWLWKVRDVDLSLGDVDEKRASNESSRSGNRGSGANITTAEEGGVQKSPKLPTRLDVTLKGVEWFIYNRSAAYDSIIAGLFEVDSDDAESVTVKSAINPYLADGLKKRGKSSDADNGEAPLNSVYSNTLSSYPTFAEKDRHESHLAAANTFASTGTSKSIQIQNVAENSADGNIVLQFLPIFLECTKAAIVVGNENTKSVLIIKFDKFSGEIDATACKAPDQYRQLFNLDLEHPVIQIKRNDDFKEDQATAASRARRGFEEQLESKVHRHSLIHRYRRKAWHKLQNLIPYFTTSVESFSSNSADGHGMSDAARLNDPSNRWQGLSRYLDEDQQDDKARWSAIEYATVSTILDSPGATLSYYWDIPGNVPAHFKAADFKPLKGRDINGTAAPSWGLDLILRGAVINYGPWADRQRAELQRVFVPSLCKDSVPSRMLRAGQKRISTVFQVYIQFDGETILRIPIREESKNWKWKAQADTMGQRIEEQKKQHVKGFRKNKGDKGVQGPEVRPFGWIDMKLAANATIRYSMDMFAGTAGFENKLDLDLPTAEITTSVNHGLLWRSMNQRLSCDLSNPLKWNGLHTWKFDIESNELELFILREHIFLLIDLVEDWSAGPPSEYLTFSPFRYVANVQFGQFKLYMNANDSNIINNPSDFDDNTFLIIFGKALSADVCIPIDKFRPHRNDITFDVKASTCGLNLHIPPWNTQATFLTSTELAQFRDLEICGRYQYCATTSPSNTDTLLLDVSGQSLEFQLYGFLIKYVLTIKDNYFGNDIRFKTLEEYQHVLHLKQTDPDSNLNHAQPHKKSNDLDVILSIELVNNVALLPANLYSATSNVRIEIAKLHADLRFTNYYMDLDLNLSPLVFSLGNADDGESTPMSAAARSMLYIDGVQVFGNRLFGLPPTEPTYLCNWDFSVGLVSGECSTDFLNRLSAGITAFAFTFDDDENALPSISEVPLHDVTFLRAAIERVRIWVHVDDVAFLVSMGEVNAKFNDWADMLYSHKLNLQIPDIVLACVNAESASRQRFRHGHSVQTHAYIQTAVGVTMLDRKAAFVEKRLLQQQHVRREDSRTHRTDFLLHDNLLDQIPAEVEATDPPAMCFPRIPPPLQYGSSIIAEDRSSVLTRSSLSLGLKNVRRNSAFLSTASSGKIEQKNSIRRGSSNSVPTIDEYNSGSRSRSRQRSGLPSYLTQVRDISVSTGRPSSFHSAVGENGEQRVIPPSRVSLSSPFIAPYFPLDGVEPDATVLPEFAIDNYENPNLDDDSSEIASLQDKQFDKQTEHTSFLVELNGGLRAFCDPLAIKALSRLLVAMQPANPGEILDVIQISSMTDIFKAKKQNLLTGASSDLRLDIPVINIRFANSSAFDSHKITRREFDQYDLSLLGISVISRSGTTAKLGPVEIETKKSSALHVRLKSADIAAKERLNNIDNAQAAIHGTVEDFAFWMASSDALSGSVDIKSVEVSTNSSKVEYLASLLLRTSLLATDLGDAFTSISVHSSRQLQLFTFLVLTSGQNTADALFLTRPSYVLRSATDHLRLMDSWKGVTRLRHIYASLDPATQAQISLRSFSSAEICPANVREQVMERFTHWRDWDLENLPDCTMMRNIFGHFDENSQSTATIPIRFAASLGLLSFILDPGPKQNEVALSTLAASMNIIFPKHVKNRSSAESLIDIQTTVLQVYCADVSINLNWELCELVENIFTLRSQSPEVSSQSAATPDSPIPSKPATEHHIHVIVATEKGSIRIDMINVRVLCISQGLKASFLTIERDSDSFTKTNIMIHAEAATSKIRSHYQDLTISQLRQPSIFVSRESQVLNDRVENNWKVAGKCQDLSFVVGQDPIVLLQVADLVIGDEISQIQQLLSKALKDPISKPTTHKQSNRASVNMVNIALFLDMYHISVPLLQSLRYKISGVIARASLSSRDDFGVVFDFDIKDHAHDIQTQVNDKIKSISLLQMPPTNGQITTQVGPKEAVLSIFMSLEPVQLDAAAVHSLLAALNRPEISSAIAEGRESLKTVERHITEVLGGDEKSAEQASSSPLRTLVYDAHLTFAGFHVFTDAPGGKDSKQTARLSLNLGSIQVEAANRLENYGPLLEFPEFRIALKQISFGLSRINPGVMDPCGNFTFGAYLTASSHVSADGSEVRSFNLKSDSLEINLFAATASTVVHVLGYFQDRIKDLDLSREVQYLQKLRKPNPRITIQDGDSLAPDIMPESTNLFASKYSVELLDIHVSWIVGISKFNGFGTEDENLVLSLKRFDLSTKKENSAKLTIEDLQLQIVPTSQDKRQRSRNSALLPEVMFNVGYVSTNDARRLAFQAAGKSLDLRLTSQFIIPAGALKKSIESASEQVRAATAAWIVTSTSESTNETKRTSFFGTKRIESLLVDADFAGAVVQLQGNTASDTRGRTGRAPQSGKYGQFSQDNASSTTMLRAPGLAWKIEFKDDGIDDPSLSGEIKVDASTNILYPTVVPLILELSSAIQSLVSDDEPPISQPKASPQKYMKVDDDNILTADPSAMLGKTRLNLGLRICAQEFSLSCQPIARVSATARFDDIYITFNTVRSLDHGNFFAISAAFNRFQTSVQHVYSRDSTGSFEVDSIVLSLMNSKHVSGKSGLSAILKISPMKVLVNAKQLQDFLLFREIWIPPEIRSESNARNQVSPNLSSQSFSVQRYQEVAATGAFPWNATLSIAELDVQLDLGQSIGKSAFMISNFWVSSKKSSDWEQNLCFGFDEVGVNSSGRMSGFVTLQKFRVRTSIQWPQREKALNQTPLIQGSMSFSQFRVKAAFDYQAFLVADITSVDYLMYNVRGGGNGEGDRLVAVLDGDSVQVFCTTTTASQAIALYQAMLRLVQEKTSNYEASLREIERFMKRKSVANIGSMRSDLSHSSDEKGTKSPISLQTDVVITLKAVNMGVFPSTFFDNQVFKLEALNAEAKFSVRMEQSKIRSGLGLTLGQLRIGLAGVKSPAVPKPSGDLSVDEVVASATGSRGGTILKVPKVEAVMETWQVPNSNHIDYIFKSSFEGKVEVGWNYSRISYIRGMYGNHSRALAQRLGKPLPPSAVKITGVPDGDDKDRVAGEQQKITAEVTVPQSKYEYFAVEPPIIETPQLRDMGEATPPLEWIGLHRDRLPNLTHQIVIVTLLELASEVEEAYEKILGSS